MKIDLIVTRHSALVEYLRELGIASEGVPVLTHASTEDIRGKVVAGVLPLHLAAEAAAVVEIPLALTPEDRGKELSIERLREIAGSPRVYGVTSYEPGTQSPAALRQYAWENPWTAAGVAAAVAADLAAEA